VKSNQIFERSLEQLYEFINTEKFLLRSASTLFVNCAFDARISEFVNPQFLQTSFHLAKDLRRHGKEVVANHSDVAKGSFQQCVVVGDRCKEVNLLHFSLAARALASGGRLVCGFPNKLGAKRFEKELERGWALEGNESKAQSRIFWCTKSEENLSSSVVQSWERSSSATMVPDTSLWASPGCFSWKEIDEGSTLLVSNLPQLQGRGADLGSGYGFIASHILANNPFVKRMHLLENHAVSVFQSQKNISDSRAEHVWCDITDQSSLPTGLKNLDWVVMNPPFHTAGVFDFELGKSFFVLALKLLRPGGSLYWVANRHLPYIPRLELKKTKLRMVTENSKFLVMVYTK
jgi:16S rRNA (guanine1207-N2)-methyltransferase